MLQATENEGIRKSPILSSNPNAVPIWAGESTNQVYLGLEVLDGVLHRSSQQ